MLMSDRLRPMRLAATALIVGACSGDLDLDVRVDHPAGAAVDRTTVTVYESATLTCVDVAFSRIGPDELSAVETSEQTVSRAGQGSGALSGVSRTDHKVIVARGYDADGNWITAGCAEQDLVTESTKIRITTITTVDAAIVLGTDAVDPLLAVIATTDPSGRAVPDRRVAWQVFGPAGSLPMTSVNVESPSDGMWQPTRASCTKASGAVSVHPAPPDVIGGYAVQLAAEWGRSLPPRYTRFVANFATQMLTPPTDSTKFCAVRRSGNVRRLVCLDAGTARDFEVTVSGGTPALVQRDVMNVGPEALNVVSIPGSGEDRDVYVVSTRGVLVPAFGAPAANNAEAPCLDGSCQVDDAIVVPACGAQPGRLLMKLRVTGAGQIKQMNIRGGSVSDFPLGTIVMGGQVLLDNAGCVTRADLGGGMPTLRQVVTYHIGTRNILNELVPIATRAAYACGGGTCTTNELLPGAGVGFSTGSESRMIATSVDATGVVLIELVMAPQPDMAGRDVFVERRRIPSAAAPDRVVVGQFDADGEHDMFWNIGTRRGTSFEIAYARDIGGQALAALSDTQALAVTSLVASDLNGDGFDDIVAIGGVDALTFGVVVIPTGTRAQQVTVPADSTCQ